MTPPDARMRPDPYPRRLWAAIDHGEHAAPEDTPYTFDTEEQARGFLGGMPGEVVEVEVRRVAPEPGGEAIRTAPVAEGKSPPTFVTNAEHAEALGLLRECRATLREADVMLRGARALATDTRVLEGVIEMVHLMTAAIDARLAAGGEQK